MKGGLVADKSDPQGRDKHLQGMGKMYQRSNRDVPGIWRCARCQYIHRRKATVPSPSAPQEWQLPSTGSHSGLVVQFGSEKEKTGKKTWSCCCCWPCPCFALAVTIPIVNYNLCLSVNVPLHSSSDCMNQERAINSKTGEWIRRLSNKQKSV